MNIRTEIIKILANNGDEPQNTVDDLEKLIYERASESYWAGVVGREAAEWLVEYKDKQDKQSKINKNGTQTSNTKTG